MRLRHRLLPGLLLVLVLALAPAAARAADAHAPRGARADWLPSAEWVMSSWLPYDQARLDALLHTDRAQLGRWLDDRRTLGQLAAQRGWRSRRALAAALVAPRTRGASAATTRRLRTRALQTLTQAHLARHVLLHVFHTPAIPRHAQRIFGMSPARYRRLRDAGLSPARIARRGGRTPQQARAALDAVLRERGRGAVRSGAMSRRQAATLLAQQRAGLTAYVHRRYRTPQQQLAYICRPR
jgi:hypothetical protein